MNGNIQLVSIRKLIQNMGLREKSNFSSMKREMEEVILRQKGHVSKGRGLKTHGLIEEVASIPSDA